MLLISTLQIQIEILREDRQEEYLDNHSNIPGYIRDPNTDGTPDTKKAAGDWEPVLLLKVNKEDNVNVKEIKSARIMDSC